MSDPAATNRWIEQFIGAPVSRYDAAAEDDVEGIGIYNIFKPAILKFFYACNKPVGNNRTIVRLTMANFESHFGNDFMRNAAEIGLIPTDPQNNYSNDVFIDAWFQMLFQGNEDSRLSIVIQGGEALNFYTTYKYESVPTHDADTRILAGNHFNYLTPVANVPDSVRLLMHRYRFFVGMGLNSYFKTYIDIIQAQENRIQNFLARILPMWNIPAEVRFHTLVNNRSLQTLIENQTYDIDDNIFISRLMSVNAIVRIIHPVPANPPAQGEAPAHPPSLEVATSLVDLMCPFRVPLDNDRNRNGQSDNIHSYFATEQARTTTGGLTDPNPAGHIPSYDIDLTLSPHLPLFSGHDIEVRLVPLGFMIFETLRMNFVSKVYQSNHWTNKMEKYKQKLNVILSTLMREDITNAVFRLCDDASTKTTNANLQPILVGGMRTKTLKANHSNSKIEHVSPRSVQTKQRMSTDCLEYMSTDEKYTLSKEEKKQARLFSIELASKKESDIHPESFTKIQNAGYMDYLSYQDSNFKDFRLPMLSDEIQKILSIPALPTTEKMMKDFIRVSKKPTNYRRTTLKIKRQGQTQK